MIQAIFYYCKAFKFFRKGWFWKYGLLSLLNFILVLILTIAIFIGIVISLVSWAESIQVNPIIQKIIVRFLRGLEQTYHYSLPTQKPLVICIQIVGFFMGIIFSLGLQEMVNRPYYKKIAHRVERATIGKVNHAKNSQSDHYFQEIFQNLRKVLIWIPLYFLFFVSLILISFIPYIGMAVMGIFACYGTGTYYMNYGIERLNLDTKIRKRKMWKNIFTILTFGAICCGGIALCFWQLYLLPLLLIFFNPLQVSAGTLLAIRIFSPTKK